MATWGGAKTDYQPTDPLTNSDVNRRETNLEYLKDEADSIRQDFDDNIDQGVKTTDSPVFANVTAGNVKSSGLYIQAPTAGDTYKIMSVKEAETDTDSTSYRDTEDAGLDENRSIGFTALLPGTIRIKLSHRIDSGSFVSSIRILVNGSVEVEWTTSSTSDVSRAQDVSIDTGDKILIQNKSDSGGQDSTWSNIAVYSGVKTFAVA